MFCFALSLLALAGSMGCFGGSNGSSSGSTAPNYSLSANPSALQVPSGGSGYSVVSVSRVNGFTGEITLSVRGLPPGVVASGLISDGSPSGYLIITVARDVSPGSLDNLSLEGLAGSQRRTAAFSLMVAAPLPVSNLSPDLVHASGGQQTNANLNNTAFAAEPLAHDLSSDTSGTTEVRHGFLPQPSPSIP